MQCWAEIPPGSKQSLVQGAWSFLVHKDGHGTRQDSTKVMSKPLSVK